MAKKSKKELNRQFQDITAEIDGSKLLESIKAEFHDFPDARDVLRCIYPAWYLLLVILCGYLADGNTLEAVYQHAELRASWFSQLTGTTLGAPSQNTLWWFLARVDPSIFKQLITRWFEKLSIDLKNQLLVIDGKRLRGVSNDEHITHIVELFSAEDRIVIAQCRVPDKTGEIQALPDLLEGVSIEGAIVSMDALYANVKTTRQILECGADYIVGIKDNQPTLAGEVRNYFEQAREANYEYVDIERIETLDKGHGRIEIREVCVAQNLEWLPQKKEWGLQSLIEVRTEQSMDADPSFRYYGSSRKGSATQFAGWIRGHWTIENNLHWVADVVFQEDASLANAGHSAENMSMLRRLAMNIVQVFDPGRGMAAARRCAAYCPEYLRGLLSKAFF